MLSEQSITNSGGFSTTVQGEHQSEDALPPTEPVANEQVSSDSTEQAVPTEEPAAATAPDLNQSNLESELNEEAVA